MSYAYSRMRTRYKTESWAMLQIVMASGDNGALALWAVTEVSKSELTSRPSLRPRCHSIYFFRNSVTRTWFPYLLVNLLLALCLFRVSLVLTLSCTFKFRPLRTDVCVQSKLANKRQENANRPNVPISTVRYWQNKYLEAFDVLTKLCTRKNMLSTFDKQTD